MASTTTSSNADLLRIFDALPDYEAKLQAVIRLLSNIATQAQVDELVDWQRQRGVEAVGITRS